MRPSFLASAHPLDTRLNYPAKSWQASIKPRSFWSAAICRWTICRNGREACPKSVKTIAVIGGGDTSVDCARTARRLQVQHGFADGSVVDYYRGTESEIRARKMISITPRKKEYGTNFWQPRFALSVMSKVTFAKSKCSG